MAWASTQGRRFHLPAHSAAVFYTGNLVAQLVSTGKVVPFGTAGSGPAIGKTTMDLTGDGTNRIEIETDCVYLITNGLTTDAFSEATPIGAPVYGLDDHTAVDNSNSGTLQRIGTFRGMHVDGRVKVFVGAEAALAAPFIQVGSGTFAAGVLTVAAGITVTADSKVFPVRKTEAGTDGDEIRVPTADRTVGGPGTGSLVFRSFLSGVAAVSDTSTFDYLIVG